MTHAKNYINYLYEHLDTSYNANTELSSKTDMIINMKKNIESDDIIKEETTKKYSVKGDIIHDPKELELITRKINKKKNKKPTKWSKYMENHKKNTNKFYIN